MSRNISNDQLLNSYFSSLQVEVITGGLLEADCNWFRENFTPKFYRFKYVLSGCCRIVINKNVVLAKRGSLYLLPDSGEQSYSLDEGCSSCLQYWVHFHATVNGISPLFHALRIPLSVPIKKTEEPELLQSFDALSSLLRVPADPACVVMRSVRLLEILAIFLDRANGMELCKNSEMDAVTEHIEKNLGKPLEVTELARMACLEPTYFSRKFRQQFGVCPSVWIMRRRLDKARFLLLHSCQSVANIAAQTGFCDAFQFSRIFRKHMGISPLEWRKVKPAHKKGR